VLTIETLSLAESFIKARNLKGGLGYTEEQLRDIWGRIINIGELRQMRKPLPESELFGEEILSVMVGQKSKK
jgi:hypothetical protein